MSYSFVMKTEEVVFLKFNGQHDHYVEKISSIPKN